ncbi:aminotransferase class V-fold PLP-dependent enzyme [Antarcticibacterium flavum]|uniref:Aminotransferase class V-fold PLP-dependent enzyme n=1 Tax=Antarcticibacterium flavum TaxID=2058175 RepID=A0A5B7WZB8_9FLAO|nr:MULTISPECIES: aminotransferase class V-fold PLP-dependent enzyme [Antarcticibacterium]MCM4161221.1 L-2,4-diaminobutyrate decarboxylase [Antarcticibacterium sp. W02-3]QCY68459.1 aminotransferase class V-fold PLP-dependent enzyme [Antarcticibacterium flavum]
MNDLKDRILALQLQSAALEPGEGERDRLLEELQYYSNNFINSLGEQKAYIGEKADVSTFQIGEGTRTLKEVLEIYSREVAAKGVKPASGGHMGYIPGGGIFTAALGDYLADVTNEYAGISFASPGAVAMEHALLNWMKSLFNFPETAVGNLTSGGSIANMIALTAARDKYVIKGAQIEKSVVYLSEHLHHCNLKALRIIGLEDVVIRHLQLDERSRIDPGDLEKKVNEDKLAGLKPFLVIASAGTTDTGAVDPLKDIGEICLAEDLWFHIDAAYGGFFILTEKCKSMFRGIGLANSLAIDPHKGLFLPFGLGAVLIKDREAVFHSHHHNANYMQDAKENAEVIDPADVSPELTKHFRALRLWLPLQLHGTAPFIACLQEKLLLTKYFRIKLKEAGFKLGPEPDLTVSYFWWPLAVGDENSFNKRLIKEIHRDGRVFLTSTTIKGKFVIRLAILSFRSKIETVDRAMEMILTAKEKVLAEDKDLGI